jgi:hypothetical protein
MCLCALAVFAGDSHQRGHRQGGPHIPLVHCGGGGGCDRTLVTCAAVYAVAAGFVAGCVVVWQADAARLTAPVW